MPTAHAAAPVTGHLFLESDLRVDAGDTLAIAGNSSVSGPGRILVFGNLSVEGNASSPVTISVPILVSTSGNVTIAGARFHDVRGAALSISRGVVRVRASEFDLGDVGIEVAARQPVSLALDAVHFVANREAGLTISGPGDVEVTNGTTFTAAGVWGLYKQLDASEGSSLAVRDARFESNAVGAYLRSYGDPGGPNRATFASSTFAGPNGTTGLAVVSSGTGAELPSVMLRGDTFSGLGVGLAVDGDAASVALDGDHFVGNAIGLRARSAAVTVARATFENSTILDVDANPALDLSNAIALKVANGGPVVVAPPPPSPPSGLAALWLLVAPLAVVVVALALSHDARHAVARPFVAFHRRVSPELAALERKLIVRHVAEHPGVFAGVARHETNLSRTAFALALARLADDGALVVRNDGAFVRLYPRGADPTRPPTLRSAERGVLEAIAASPGMAQSELANRLGLSRQALHYHVKKLEKAGYVRKRAEGRETLCYATDAAKRVLDGDAGARTARPERL
ncbi:MAG: MarR family transcriptional regulator [Thermoplasmatota archaeon]